MDMGVGIRLMFVCRLDKKNLMEVVNVNVSSRIFNKVTRQSDKCQYIMDLMNSC